MTRRVLFLLIVLALGCRAQVPDSTLNKRIERNVRAALQIPPYVNIAVTGRKSSTEFDNYDTLSVKLSAGDKSQNVDFLISKDNTTLYSLSKVDLSKDPYAEMMEKIDISGRPIRGNKSAKVTVVIYDDFQCPYCSHMHQTVLSALKKYGDKVRFIYKDYPLFEIHPWAGRAAIDSQCLANLSTAAYWEFADYVHANADSISGPRDARKPLDKQLAEIDRITLDIGKKNSVDSEKLQVCVKVQPKLSLDASVKEAESVGVQATPVAFVNGQKLDGAVPEAQFDAVLDQALADAGEGTPKPATK